MTARFGFLGAVFGSLFALFYVLIGHQQGAIIVVVCSAGFAAIPWLLRRTESLSLAGNSLCAILILGFTALCCVEGGLEGHSIAWLVSVPLCALLLVGVRAATWWVLTAFIAGGGIVLANFSGVRMEPTYDLKWHPYVSAAGYLSLIAFMFLLGVIFEAGRERAFAGMREALSKLETSNEQLARLSQEKTDFLGIAAHDLKNPLTVIIGSAELLKLNVPPDQVAKLSENIAGAGQRMFQLIKDLLDANAIEQGRFTSNLQRCDLRAIAAECVANNRTHAVRKEISIVAESGAPIWSRADRNATMQVLDNLISNALKYSPPKTTVHIRAFVEHGFARVAVKDRGPGISEADQRKLFGKFTRLSARPTGGESSTGLGLSIAKKLAEAMCGSVACQSVLGEGATFILSLPAWDAVPESSDSPRPAKSERLPVATDSREASLLMSQLESSIVPSSKSVKGD
ncbi:MAG TPA: HAMP domain-containing sensor histidine kinase [Verrucomicrobiae bacterium]|nr:HAMP domain-containing sensor histidine kinase [Verrucomicrobiae bacterium]